MFLFIESNTTGTGRRFLEAAIESSTEVVFASDDPSRYQFMSGMPVDIVQVDTSDLAALDRIVAQIGTPSAVFSNTDRRLEIVAAFAERHGLFGQPPASIRSAQDKLVLFKALRAGGVPVPETVEVDGPDECSAAARRVGLPCIVKPRRGTGSVGVRLCWSLDEVVTQVGALREQRRGNEGILLQEYVDGSEHSVECIGDGASTHVLAVIDKHLGQAPHFVETGHDCPTLLAESVGTEVGNVAKRALRTVGLTSGATHTEIRVRDGRAVVIEINPRPAGGMIPALIEISRGIRVFHEVLKLHLGRSIDLAPKFSRAGAIRFILPSGAGEIAAVKGLDRALRGPGVRDVDYRGSVGAPVALRGDFSDRIAHVVASGATPHEAVARSEAAAREIQTDIQPRRDDLFTLRPHVRRLVERDVARPTSELSRQTDVDKAHVVMLNEVGSLSGEEASTLLRTIDGLVCENFHPVLNMPKPRGTYLAYEAWLIGKTGREIGGRLHTARSRNDINATLNKLLLRESIQVTMSELLRLRRTVLEAAAAHGQKPFLVHSQLLAAMPSTVSHYMLAIEDAVSAHSGMLLANADLISTCPMGAVAGAGTSIPIDPVRTARLLGFERPAANSLSAVADRSAALAVLATFANIGVTLSRIAQDIHQWATQDPRLVAVPDDLTSGSSAMPHKRNPYLLEWLKATSSRPAAAFISASMSMLKTPFSNSYEVSGVAMEGIDEAARDVCRMAGFACELLATVEFRDGEALRRVGSTNAFSTLVLERMVTRLGMPTRDAHEVLSSFLHGRGEALDDGLHGLWEETSVEAGSPALANELRFGGGPGDATAMASARDRLSGDCRRMRHLIRTWAEARLERDDAVWRIINAERP